MFCSCPSFMVFRNTSPESALRVAMSKSDLHLLESVSEVGARRRTAPAMYSGTARRRAALEDLGCLVGVLGRHARDVEVGALAGRRSHDAEPFIGDAPHSRHDRARNRLRTAADGDRSTAQPSRAVPPRAAADPRARAPRRAGRRPAARPPSARSAG